MSKLGRLWNWLQPGLVSLSPCGAIAYHLAIDDDETSDDGSVPIRRKAVVPNASRDMRVVEMIDAPLPALLGQ